MKFVSLLGSIGEGLPEFDAVAFGVGDPGKAAVGFVLSFGVYGDAFGGQLSEECIEVVDAVVDHVRLGCGAEVFRVGGEDVPGGAAGGGWDFVGP